ncbi:MAG: GDSL-type esterase/lipase family protein [Phycisphaerae bacterium]|nr:GDSL-type esterase/lipase family protein [Phycisphaerae bacterium]
MSTHQDQSVGDSASASPQVHTARSARRGGGRWMASLLIVAAIAFSLGFIGRRWWDERPRSAKLPPDGAPRPIMADYYRMLADQFAIADPHVPAGSIVWLGDSITDFMRIDDLVESDRALVNRGISGDTTAGVLERIRRGFPAGAAACVLMIGHNDLARGADPGATADRVGEICAILRERHGVSRVLVEGMLPSTRVPPERVAALNLAVQERIRGRDGCRWIQLDDKTPGRSWDASAFCDGVHLSAAGVRQRLRRELQELRVEVPEATLKLREAANP